MSDLADRETTGFRRRDGELLTKRREMVILDGQKPRVIHNARLRSGDLDAMLARVQRARGKRTCEAPPAEDLGLEGDEEIPVLGWPSHGDEQVPLDAWG